MDDKTQKERLEQELRFLKESFEAEVISKEEFEKGKDRLEKKLREIERTEKKQPVEEKNETVLAKPEESKKEITEDEEKTKPIQEEAEKEYFEPAQGSQQKEALSEKPAFKEQKRENKFFKYALVFVVLLLVVFFSYSFLKTKKNIQESSQSTAAACNSDADCRQDEKEGICLHPGTKNAKCEVREIPKINAIILNDRKKCFNCDTQRVLGILESWFGHINAVEINYNTEEGKNISEKFDAKMLPMYILDENITGNTAFEQFRQAFVKKNGSYTLSDSAAGASFYINRESIPNKLDMFIIAGDDASARAEKNIKEFLDNFKNIKFEKHLQNDNLTRELGIKNFPAFLVNSKDKFTGIQSAETIKENFCKMNQLPECQKSLSKNLV